MFSAKGNAKHSDVLHATMRLAECFVCSLRALQETLGPNVGGFKSRGGRPAEGLVEVSQTSTLLNPKM